MNNQNSNFLLSPTSMTTSFPFPIASPSASPSMQFYFSPVPTPIIVLPSPSPVAFHIASPPPVRVTTVPAILNSLLGDWITYADSRSPRKYANMDETMAPVKRIEVQENAICRVIFSDISSEHQSFEIRQLADGRLHLSSSKDPSYSFTSFGPFVIGNLQWQNAFDPTHFVSWKQIPDDVVPVPSHPPQFVNRNSSVRSVSRDCSRLSPYPDSNHSFSFTSASSDEIPQYLSSPNYADQEGYSRHASPERDEDTMNKLESEEVLSLKHAQMIPRDSKQNLVNKVEPLVDDLIGDLYAKEEDYRANRNGRFGPPVLRGDDVLFIPAKKQISLENVVEFLEAIQSNSMIVAASKVCQKKKKRQKKGFLIYLKFTSAQEAHNVLEHVYADFREKMPGVKHAIFEKPKSTITMPCVMKSPSF